jgi:hypothetical protein
MLEHLLRVALACLAGSIVLGGLAQLQQRQALLKRVRHVGRRPGSTPEGARR